MSLELMDEAFITPSTRNVGRAIRIRPTLEIVENIIAITQKPYEHAKTGRNVPWSFDHTGK